MKRLTEYDAATPEADAADNQKEKWVLLPKFIPLPAGTELPPCILGSALIGSKDLIVEIRAFRLAICQRADSLIPLGYPECS